MQCFQLWCRYTGCDWKMAGFYETEDEAVHATKGAASLEDYAILAVERRQLGSRVQLFSNPAEDPFRR